MLKALYNIVTIVVLFVVGWILGQVLYLVTTLSTEVAFYVLTIIRRKFAK